MYDPVTRQLIQSAPALSGLDRTRLAEELTQVYASLVSARLVFRQQPNSGAWRAEVDRVTRLANTYETYAAVLTERTDRESAAFVAATAHGLLALARLTDGQPDRTVLGPDSISPDVSACLLFLTCGYIADAAEVARAFDMGGPDGGTEVRVLHALQALALGRVARAVSIVEEQGEIHRADAASHLYLAVLRSLGDLARAIRDGIDNDAESQLRAIQERAATVQDLGLPDGPRAVLAFSGPHHLATLLLAATTSLLGRRMSIVPRPPDAGPDWEHFRRGISVLRPYLWRSHQDAIASGFLQPGVSAVLSFPTGSGKSTMAELKIAGALSLGRQVLYLSPTHALVSQTARDLRNAFPTVQVEDSLVAEGSYGEVEAQTGRIAVMTPERALTVLSADPEELADVGLIIMDECHLLHPSRRDRTRRNIDAMFCLLAGIDRWPAADVLLMSAMMANHAELARWLSELTGRSCVPLTADWKPTRQLRGCVVFDETRVGTLQTALTEAKRKGQTKAPGAVLKRSLTAQPLALFGLRQTWTSRNSAEYKLLPLSAEDVLLGASDKWWAVTPNRNQVSADIALQFAQRGMRVLVFAKDPVGAESLAQRVVAQRPGRPALTPDEARLLAVAAEEVGSESDILGLTTGSAATHHGLLLPVERILVESLCRRSGTESIVLVGTPTLAQGINLPAEVVIVSGDDRVDPVTKKAIPLEPEELLNAVARAGRAGHASVGVVLIVPGGIVTVHPTEHRLGERWFQLQEDVFSKMDQCLTIDDPLGTFVDVIQTSTVMDAEVSYFLNRLSADEEAVRRTLDRSLGGHRARWRSKAGEFRAKVDRVVALRLTAGRELPDTVLKLAVTSGIDVKLASELTSEVVENAASWAVETVDEVVTRFFDWLRISPARADLLLRPSASGAPVALENLQRWTRSWTNGGSLRELEAEIAGEVSAGCWEARKFALRRIPDIAYGVGVVAHAYRLSVGDDGEVPLALAVGAECVKRGLDSPEKLALAYELGGEHSRAEYARILSRLEVEASSVFEDFGEVRSRVGLAIVLDETS